MEKPIYLIWDERSLSAWLNDDDDFFDKPVMVACASLSDARSYRGDYGEFAGIFKIEPNDEMQFVEALATNRERQSAELSARCD